MSKINKFNEFINIKESLIIELINEGENTPLSDLEAISNRKPYKEVIKLGKEVTPYLLNRLKANDSPIWVNALCEINNIELDSTKISSSERVNFWKNWAVENGF